jgi:hypothetical protein
MSSSWGTGSSSIVVGSRRALLTGAAGALGVVAAETVGRVPIARANDGDTMLVGRVNKAASHTTLNCTSNQTALVVSGGADDSACSPSTPSTAGAGIVVTGGTLSKESCPAASGGANGGTALVANGGSGISNGGGPVARGPGIIATGGSGGQPANGLIAKAGGGGNASGIVSTGSGSLHGVDGRGGSSSGNGVVGRGGAPNGVGVIGLGAGTGEGMRGTGGASGGSHGGTGVHGIGGSPAGTGVSGEGSGSGFSGVGGKGTSGANGVTGLGIGAGDGVNGSALGGGSGVKGVAGFANAVGVTAENTMGGTALDVNGRATFSGSGIASIPAGSSTKVVTPGQDLTSSSIVLATLQNSGLGMTLIRSAVPDPSAGTFKITLNQAVPAGRTALIGWFIVN